MSAPRLGRCARAAKAYAIISANFCRLAIDESDYITNIKVSDRRIGLRCGVGVVALALAAPAVAQDAKVTAETEETAETAIIVTGTRIQRPEAATAPPFVAVTKENIT